MLFSSRQTVPFNGHFFNRRTQLNGLTPPYCFGYARTALKYGLQSLGLKKGDKILLPDYICDVVLHPLQQLELTPVFFPVNDSLNPKWDELEKICRVSKALLFAHYFGQIADIEKYSEFCMRKSIYMIEDASHCHGARINDREIGTFGDIGISSPRKSFPIINGGFLFSKKNINVANIKLRLEKLDTWNGIKHHVKIAILGNNRKIGLNQPRPDYASQDAWREPLLPDYGMDSSAYRKLCSMDYSSAANIRREIYSIWDKWVRSKSLSPMFNQLNKDSVPLAYPARTKNQTESIRWFDWGWSNGIEIHSWPTLPREIANSKNSNAMDIWRTTVCFPIHQGMNPSKLADILRNTPPP